MTGFAALLYAGFQALAAIPTLVSQMESLAGTITLWYIQRQTSQTIQLIANAAALSARAKTEEDRYASAQAWQNALTRPRITPN